MTKPLPPAEQTATGSSPRRIRQNNVAAALQALFASGGMSRADLARRLGLNRSSSGHIVAALAESGFVRDVEEPPQKGAPSRAGRPGIVLDLVPEAAMFMGIEIGFEHISTVLIDLAGQLRRCRKQVFDAPSASVEQAVCTAVSLGFGDLAPEMAARCSGVGVSVPAHIGADGSISLAPLIGWRDVPLAQIARDALPAGMPVAIENDANAFAIGDSYRHGQSGVTLFLLMETGVGGGILIDGKLFRGGHGLAGEIGHTLVPGSGGQKFEQLIGRETLVVQYREAIARPDADLADFLSAVRDRVPVAVTIAETWSRHLAFALMQACRLIDPDRIVLGGSVAALYPMVSARVAAHMAEGQTIAFPAPRIAVDESAEFGSAFGAACLMHQRFLSLESDLAQPGDRADVRLSA